MGKCMTKRIPYHICQTFCYKIAAVSKDACKSVYSALILQFCSNMYAIHVIRAFQFLNLKLYTLVTSELIFQLSSAHQENMSVKCMYNPTFI